MKKRLAETPPNLAEPVPPAAETRLSELGFDADPPSDWIFDVRKGTGFDLSGGWLFTAFAPRARGVAAAEPSTRLEVFYLPVQGARRVSRTQLVDYLVLVLDKRRQAASNATASSAVSSDDKAAPPVKVASDLNAYARVATPGTLPKSVARDQDGQYAIALDLRVDSTPASPTWQEHWAVVRAGQEIIYVALGVPGNDPTRRQELEKLMSSITLEDPDDESVRDKGAAEEPRKGDAPHVP